MKLDFRCDKCDKMLKIEADPGDRIRCPNCRGWTRVPAILGQLPHPHVSPEAEFCSARIAVKDESEDATPVVLAAIGAGMPWVISAMMHVGAFLIMLFVMMVAAPVLPQGARADAPPGPNAPGLMGKFQFLPCGVDGQSSPPTLQVVTPHWRDPTIGRSPMPNATDIDFVDPGVGNSRLGKDLKDGTAPGAGLFGVPIYTDWFPGGVVNVVYVVDRSGSMARIFEEVKGEMIRSISRLRDEQKFHVVLFGDGLTIEGPRRGLVGATFDNKVAALEFLREKQAKGSTTALVALQRAFAILAARPANEGKLIYLVSDGDFSGLSGGSQYRAADGRTLGGNEAVQQWLAENNKGPKVRIHTVLLHSSDESAVKVLKAIAQSNGGQFKYISPDE